MILLQLECRLSIADAIVPDRDFCTPTLYHVNTHNEDTSWIIEYDGLPIMGIVFPASKGAQWGTRNGKLRFRESRVVEVHSG